MTGRMVERDGFRFFVPNDIVVREHDFYVSLNTYDTAIYGCTTTALVRVVSSREHFYVLNGDHAKEYRAIVEAGGGIEECLEYFCNHSDQISKYSEKMGGIDG